MKSKPKFYVLYKDFNTGNIESYDVLGNLFSSILTSNGHIRKNEFHIYDKDYHLIPIKTKEQLQEYIDGKFRYYYWSKCEWEFVVIDWPHRNTIEDSRPVKIDVYSQLKPNLPVITDIVWNYIEDKIE